MAYQLNSDVVTLLDQIYEKILLQYLPENFTEIPAIQQLKKNGFKLTSIEGFDEGYKPDQIKKFFAQIAMPEVDEYRGDLEFQTDERGWNFHFEKDGKTYTINDVQLKVYTKKTENMPGQLMLGLFKNGELLDFEGKGLKQIHGYFS